MKKLLAILATTFAVSLAFAQAGGAAGTTAGGAGSSGTTSGTAGSSRGQRQHRHPRQGCFQV
jgi:hypothetical protein